MAQGTQGTQGNMDIAFFQFNPGLYNNQSYLPYAVGAVWAYAKTFPEIEASYRNVGFRFLRERPEAIAAGFENVDVACFSTYLWNWEISNNVAIALKRRFPHAMIVFGGPQVPNDASTLLATHPHIDIAVHGEGEATMADILKARLTDEGYVAIPGMSAIGPNGFHCKQMARDPIRDLDTVPSPYLTGLFDALFDGSVQFQATWETNRGCPYQCTFCYYGAGHPFIQKLRQFSLERLFAEIDYFGERKISHILVADANFGILPRDLDLARRLAEVKARTNGFPTKIKTSTAKNSTERVVDIARILNKEKLDRGISLAVQSMDEATLVNIKRKNLKIESLAGFMHQYQQEGIPSYVELILGMPGETYESFRDGISRLLEAGAHDSLFLHKGIVLPNTEMSEPAYVAEHGLKTLRVPATLTHSAKHSEDVQEYEELIIATHTMPHEEWREAYLFSWAVLTCHILRVAQVPPIYAAVHEGFSYGRFYDALIDYARRHPETIIGQELRITEQTVDEALKGMGFDVVLPEFSDIVWPPEEASFLRICMQLDRFFEEYADFLRELARNHDWEMDETVLADMVRYQKAIIVKYDRDGSREFELQHSIHSFYRDQLEGRHSGLKRGRFRVVVQDDLQYAGNKQRFAKEIPFWGRRGGQMNYKHVRQEALEIESELPLASGV